MNKKQKMKIEEMKDLGKKLAFFIFIYIIRYHEPIPFNPDKPLCYSCYKVWVEFGDSDYSENYCHACGERSNTSYRKPLCNECYK